MDLPLKALVDAPLADPNKVYLPLGRKPPVQRPQAEKDGALANSRARRVRLDAERPAKVATLLDYYATTTVPVERVAKHVGLTIDEARKGLRQRGRS